MRGLWLFALMFLAAVAAAAAAPLPTAQQLRDAQHAHVADQAAQQAALAEAAKAAAEEQSLTADRVEAAARLRATETDLANAAAAMAELARRRDLATTQLDAQSRALLPLMPLLERLSLYPAETLLVAPMPPEQAVRGALVLGGISRELRQAAASLSAQRADLDALQQQMDAQQRRLAAAQALQAQQAQTLDAQLTTAHDARIAARAQAGAATERAAADVARADTLRAAIAALDADRRARTVRDARATRNAEAAAPDMAGSMRAPVSAPVAASVAASTGWTVPVAGRVTRAFGTATEAGPATGVSYSTPPGARVVSACSGRVVFAGLFRSFGQLVIVDCGAATHVVLAGLSRLDVQLGQSVRSGEPVGIMAGNAQAGLYVELRRAGQAIDPAPYLHSEVIFSQPLRRTSVARAVTAQYLVS